MADDERQEPTIHENDNPVAKQHDSKANTESNQGWGGDEMNEKIDLDEAKKIVKNEDLRDAKKKAAPTKMDNIPKAVGVPIPPRCMLKCRRKSEVVIVSQSGGLLFLCQVDAEELKATGTIPPHRIPEKPKKDKK